MRTFPFFGHLLPLAIHFLCAGSAAAATLDVRSGLLHGASNVFVSGFGVFDVSFVEGTCAEVYSGCDDVSDFTFDTQAGALAASDAILSQVIFGPQFDAVPGQTYGCNTRINAAFCLISTVYGPSDNDPFTPTSPSAWAVNYSGPTADETSSFRVSVQDTSLFDNSVRAVWSVVDLPPISEVPLPASGLLLFGGLLGIGSVRAISRKSKLQ